MMRARRAPFANAPNKRYTLPRSNDGQQTGGKIGRQIDVLLEPFPSQRPNLCIVFWGSAQSGPSLRGHFRQNTAGAHRQTSRKFWFCQASFNNVTISWNLAVVRLLKCSIMAMAFPSPAGFSRTSSLFFSLMLLLWPGQKHIVYQQSFFSYRTAVNSL